MKARELIKKLKYYGWYLVRQGGNHEIWGNGELTEPVPRHREIDENLANKILRKARNNPAKKIKV